MALAIALTSFAALLLELALTRLFSVVLFHHFAFLAISIALLGLGAGGVAAFVLQGRLARWGTRQLASAACLANAAAMVIVLEVVLRVPVSMQLNRRNLAALTVIYLASAVPFAATGLVFSVVFSRESGRIPQLYGADLLGGAVACVALVPLLNVVGAPNAIVIAAGATALASAAWGADSRARIRGIVGALALSALVAANRNGGLIDIIYAKGDRVDRSLVEFARWNALSRIEVLKVGDEKSVVIDADASTFVMNADPHDWSGTHWGAVLMNEPPSLANVLRPRGEFAIIGPGGGVDVLRAVANGSPRVTGIEINPLIANTVMRERYAGYSKRLYGIPEVSIHVSDGRSFVRGSTDRWDVIQMTLVDTWASTAAGAFALSENNLYTTEAFGEYFAHLKPDGMIAVTRWEFREPREALRVVSVAMAALHAAGVSDVRRNFIVASDGELAVDGIPVVVLAKKSPFTPAEEAAVRAHLASHPNLRILYLPSAPADNAFGALIAGNDPAAFSRGYAFNVSPVTDDQPFFFFTVNVSQVLSGAFDGRAADWKVNLGVAVLAMVLVISIIAVVAFLVLPLLLHGGTPAEGARLPYFVAVGVGFILVEITFIQRFVLFLGHPTYALTVVVFLLLLSSGIGSMLSRKWMAQPGQARWALAVIVAILAVYAVLLPALLGSLVGAAFPVKLLMSGALLIPLGIAMGMPFPTGLRALGSTAGRSTVEWAWAINAASSVLGSVLAIVIAINFGLTVTLLCGTVAYAVALLLTGTLPVRATATGTG